MLCRNCAAATPTMMMTLRKTWTTQCWATSSSNRAKRSSVVANCAPVAPSIRLAGAELAALSTASGPNQTRKSRGQFFVTGGGGRIVCLGSYLHGHAAADLVGGVRARVLLADDHGCEREESARGRCGCDRGREYLYDRSFHGVASCRQAKRETPEAVTKHRLSKERSVSNPVLFAARRQRHRKAAPLANFTYDQTFALAQKQKQK